MKTEPIWQITKEFIRQHNLRFTYLRNKRREKIGIICSFQRDGAYYVGVSKMMPSDTCQKCHQKRGDRFNRNYGLAQAIDNAQYYNPSNSTEFFPDVPEIQSKTTNRMYDQYAVFLKRLQNRLEREAF